MANKLALTLGDPSGVGPALVASAILAAPEPLRRRLVVFCDLPILEREFARLSAAIPSAITVVNRGQLSPDQATPGRPSSAGAAAQVAYLEAVVHAAQAGTIAGLVTAPISKSQAKTAGFAFPGHTEFLTTRLGAQRGAMMFVGPRRKIILATVHMALADVPRAITTDAITDALELGVASMTHDFGIAAPTVGVLGLNPHAGEGGLFGREEIDTIGPAIEQARRTTRADIVGPLSPDAAYRLDRDLFVAMYHDQALIPAKLDDFHETVNVTLGLPIVRTSPDHGTAYDIAGTDQVNPQSFQTALNLCAAMVDQRARDDGGAAETD